MPYCIFADPKGEGKVAAIAFTNGYGMCCHRVTSDPLSLNLWMRGTLIVPYSRGTYQQYDIGVSIVILEHWRNLCCTN